eukprot:9674831-Alexandrium_andersonii.AAC.1
MPCLPAVTRHRHADYNDSNHGGDHVKVRGHHHDGGYDGDDDGDGDVDGDDGGGDDDSDGV